MFNAGARVVLTSRDYIYNRAKRSLKESAFPLMRESQVVIDVKEITPEERRQILYNHIKLGAQPRVFRTAIKPYLERVASHPRFIPETSPFKSEKAAEQSGCSSIPLLETHMPRLF
jgi:hypothetical protein